LETFGQLLNRASDYKAGKFDDGFIGNLHSDNTGSVGEPGKKPEERIKFPQIRIQ